MHIILYSLSLHFIHNLYFPYHHCIILFPVFYKRWKRYYYFILNYFSLIHLLWYTINYIISLGFIILIFGLFLIKFI